MALPATKGSFAVSPTAGSMGSLTETTFGRLDAALGARVGRPLGEQVMRQLGLRAISSAQDLCDFANGLMQHRGAAEFVGRSLKVTALLRGAVDRPIVGKVS